LHFIQWDPEPDLDPYQTEKGDPEPQNNGCISKNECILEILLFRSGERYLFMPLDGKYTKRTENRHNVNENGSRKTVI
jgi:hypothetical protein